jgi:Flp pilus assembly pilin Flp
MAVRKAVPSDVDHWRQQSRETASLCDEQGQTVTEYGAVLAILVIALTGVVFALQDEIAAFIDKVATAVAGILP